jgi:nucleotidyltransferase substrate binding protein (TIGR01987 family)
MDPRLHRLLQSFAQAQTQFTRALAQPKDEFVRDAAIQRFEFTFELFWKTLQAYCRQQGLEANSPRASLRTAFQMGLLDDDQRYMAMLQSRNLASHTYEEATAEAIYAALPGYAEAMHTTVLRLQAELARDEGVPS